VRGCRQVIAESWRTCMAPDPQAKVRSGRALGPVGAAVGLACDRCRTYRPQRCLDAIGGPDAKHVSACASPAQRDAAAWLTFQPCKISRGEASHQLCSPPRARSLRGSSHTSTQVLSRPHIFSPSLTSAFSLSLRPAIPSVRPSLTRHPRAHNLSPSIPPPYS